jgi:hypothetical protein
MYERSEFEYMIFIKEEEEEEFMIYLLNTPINLSCHLKIHVKIHP